MKLRTLAAGSLLLPMALAAQAPQQGQAAPQAQPAQAGTTQATPARPVPPEPLSKVFDAQRPAIMAILKDDPAEARRRVEAILPATKPEFDNANVKAGLASVSNYSTYMAMHHLAGRAAHAAGDWEGAKAHYVQALAIARENAEKVKEVLKPLMDQWSKAVDDAKKAKARQEELTAKTPRTPEEDKELENLNANMKTHDDNLAKGGKAVAQFQNEINNLKKDADQYPPIIEALDKDLKSEADELVKFKGSKPQFVQAALKSVEKNTEMAPESKVAYLRHLAVLDPANRLVQKRIDQALGKAAPEPEAPVKKKPAGHKKRS